MWKKKLYLVLRMLYIDIYPNFLSYQPVVPASTLLLQAQRRKSRSQIQRDHPRVKHRGHLMGFLDFPGSSTVKNPPAMQETCRRCRFDPWIGKIPWRRKWQPTPVFLPEKFHGLQPDKLLWEVPWTEEPGGLQCMGLQRAEHDWVTQQQQWTSYPKLQKTLLFRQMFILVKWTFLNLVWFFDFLLLLNLSTGLSWS